MRFQKTARSTVFFWGASREILNVTLVARRRKHFRGFVGDDFVADLTQKKKYFHTQEFTCILSTSVVTASRHALWRVVSNQVISALGHCWVHTPHIHRDAPERDSLFFWSCLLSVTVTPSALKVVHCNLRHVFGRGLGLACKRFIIHVDPSCGNRSRKNETQHSYKYTSINLI